MLCISLRNVGVWPGDEEHLYVHSYSPGLLLRRGLVEELWAAVQICTQTDQQLAFSATCSAQLRCRWRGTTPSYFMYVLHHSSSQLVKNTTSISDHIAT